MIYGLSKPNGYFPLYMHLISDEVKTKIAYLSSFELFKREEIIFNWKQPLVDSQCNPVHVTILNKHTNSYQYKSMMKESN